MIKKTQNQGFTLIEIMVAISIFVIVAMITTGALVSLAGASRKLQNIKTAVDNMNFTMNSMAIRIREGRGGDFDIGDGECKVSFQFQDFDGNTVAYRKRGEFVDRASVARNDSPSDSDFAHLTSDKIKVKDLWFCAIPQWDCNENCKRAITIYLVATYSDGRGGNSPIRLQTTVAQRNM